jgi:hypothetical protein
MPTGSQNAGVVHAPFAHLAEQHWVSETHTASFARQDDGVGVAQVRAPGVPPVHVSPVQHWSSSVQDAPAAVQLTGSVHAPASQTRPSQHWPSPVQPAPAAPQVVGFEQTPPLHSSGEQQSSGAAHEPPSAWHWPVPVSSGPESLLQAERRRSAEQSSALRR